MNGATSNAQRPTSNIQGEACAFGGSLEKLTPADRRQIVRKAQALFGAMPKERRELFARVFSAARVEGGKVVMP